MGPRTSGRGSERVARQAQLAAQPEDAGSGGGPESGGDAQRQATGQRAHPPAGPYPRPAPGDRDQGVSQADLPAQVGGLGPATEEPVRSGVHRAAPELLAVQRTPEPGRRLDDGDVDPADAPGPPGPPDSSQAAARPLMPPPTTTTRRTVGSAPVRRGGADDIGQDADETGIIVE